MAIHPSAGWNDTGRETRREAHVRERDEARDHLEDEMVVVPEVELVLHEHERAAVPE